MNRKVFTITLFSALFLSACAELKQQLQDVLNTGSKAQTSSTQKKTQTTSMTKIVSKDKKHTYYISPKEMDWKEAHTWCRNQGKSLADYRTGVCSEIYANTKKGTLQGVNGDVVGIVQNEYNFDGACKNLAGLTKTDTFVWFYPTLTMGVRCFIVNLRNGAISSGACDMDVAHEENLYAANHALCEDEE